LNCFNKFLYCLRNKPKAYAILRGGDEYSNLKGKVEFFDMRGGVLVKAEIEGLPKGKDVCDKPIFGFHIHEGESCSGDITDRFKHSHGHYNPNDCPHPYHSGDLPPLFGVNGKAYSVFLTDRFSLSQIIGKTVIIHSAPDDFTTQPSGNSGNKIACGVIRL